MTDSNKTIRLIFRREDYEEIYFKENQGNIYWNKSLKQYFIIVIIFAIITLLTFCYFLATNTLWKLPVFCLLIFSISFYAYYKRAAEIIKWKKHITRYLNDLDKLRKYEITLANEAFTVSKDDEIIITKWAAFTKATINDESIFLSGNESYFFPKKTMGISDYNYLKNFITDKVQNGQ